MTDYLLVHGAGQGSWAWGKVWGLMTAPEEHPPRLHKARRANRVLTIDLPGHGPDAKGDTAAVRMEECVEAIVRTVEREQLRDVVLVGHGISAGIVLQAAGNLTTPPKRVCIVGGIVPEGSRPLLSGSTGGISRGFKLLSLLSSLSRKELRFPYSFISRYLCNTMETMEVVQILGFFGPLPSRLLNSGLLNSGLSLADAPPAPVSCIVLTQDKVVSAQAQRRAAERLNSDEVVEIEACHMGIWQRPQEVADALMTYA
jgi:pimeloyl-ACP methyl ester carboxylesterase